MSSNLLYPLIRPLLFSLDAERAHHLTMHALARANAWGLGALVRQDISRDARTVMGISFPNPIGLAAGLDKDGAFIDGLSLLGFGFIEIGTVTPRAQPGNPRPRLFRVPGAQAIINRMGFNNGGLDAFVANIKASRYAGVLGLNIGKNADTPMEHAIDDYLAGLRSVYPFAHYITINISSPNTANLRELQRHEELDRLLAALKNAQSELADQYGRYVPIALKIAPDLEHVQVQDIARAVLQHRIDGVIATNTTTDHSAVSAHLHGDEKGGVSGAPVLEGSNRVIRQLNAELGSDIPIIGVGGILDGAAARAKIEAGAALVQIYSGLIYRGPRLIVECAQAVREVTSQR